MSRVRPNQPLVPSVLDRLLDDAPEITRELPASRHQVLRELKIAVRRDLENLLNTRISCLKLPAQSKYLEQSLVSYGIPDITGANLGSVDDREKFCALVQKMISRFEPRFQTVRVSPTSDAQSQDRIFHFRIDALLIADPMPEPIVFDLELRPGATDLQIKEIS